LTLAGTNAAINATGSGLATLNSDLTYSVNSTVTNSGTGLLTLGGKNTFAAGTNTTFSGSGTMVAGTTTGASLAFGNNSTVTYNGTGTFSLADGGTYTGAAVTVNLANTGTGAFNIGNVTGNLTGTLNIAAGLIKFAGATTGDLFGSALTLSVANGATFDFNGNAETMGAIAGNGIIKTTVGLTMVLTGNKTWGGSIQGTGGFSTGAASVNYTFTGNNTSTGNTTVVASSTLSLGNGGTGGTVGGNIIDNGVLTFNRSSDLTYSKVISGTGTVTKTGSNTLTLSGTSIYTGDTTVAQGTLRVITNTNTTSRNYTVADGARLTAVDMGQGGAFVMSNLTLGSTVGSNLGFEFNGATPPSGPLFDVQGGLIPNAPVNVTVTSQTPLTSNSTIQLIHYSGTIQGIGFGAFSSGTLSLPARVNGSLVNSGTSVDLSIGLVDSIKWNGNLSANWDAGTAVDVGGTKNFKLNSNAAATNFIAGDTVTFDDTAAANFTVNVPATVQPGPVLVNNTANNYTFQGAGAIGGGASLTKQGTGTLTLLNNNTYTGPTTVSGGTLLVGNGGTTGSLGAGGLINNTAVIINRSDDITYGGSITGTGGVLTKAGNNNLTLTGAYGLDGELNVAGGSVTATAAMVAGGYTVTKTGPGQLTLLGASTGFTGTLNVNGGTVLLDDLGGSGDLNANSIVINSGAKFVFGENGNPDFPNSTFVTVNTGGVFEMRQGEVYGGVILKGGTYQMNGAVRTGVNTTASDNTGYRFESGTVSTNLTGTATGGLLSGATFLEKTTAGTVNLVGGVVIDSGVIINIREGTLAMGVANVPAAGTAAITLGDGSTVGTLAIGGAGSATIGRPVAVTGGGGAIRVDDAGGSVTLGGALSGNANLSKAGAGTLTLTAFDQFSGTTNVDAGTLRLLPGTAGGGFVVASGAKLTAANVATPATLNIPTLTLGAGGSLIAFELNSTGNPTVPLLNVSTPDGLNRNGGTHGLSVSSTDLLTVGTITLIDYAGTPITSGFTLTSLPPRTLANLAYNTANTSIDLNVTGVDTLKWNGNLSADWDTGTAVDVGGTKNWKTASAATPTNFFTTDRVTFDDSAAGNFAVNIATSVQPGSVTVDNSAHTYTFQGPGSIAGATTLTKQGTGSLVVLTNNTYTGATTVSGGTLQVGNGGTSGSLGTGNLVNDANVVLNRSDDVTFGSGISGAGNLTKSGSNILTLTGALTSTGKLTIGGGAVVLNTAASYTYGGSIDGPGALTKLGAGTVSLDGAATHTGGTTINAGILRVGTGGFTGSLSGDVLVGTGATLSFNRGDDVTFSGNVGGAGGLSTVGGAKLTLTGNLGYTGATTISTGTLELKNTAPGSLNSPIAIGSNSLLVSGNADLSLGGQITGAGTITKSGTGQLTLLANSTPFTGVLTVNQGTVLLDDQGGSGDLNASDITINNGGKFIFGNTPGSNPDLPDTTFITIGAGGEFEIRIGEQWGATRLQGGTMRFTSTNANVGATSNATTNAPFTGFAFESGAVIANTGTGAATFSRLAASSLSMTKTTPGTVTFAGNISIAADMPINIVEGALAFEPGNVPATGTGTIMLGDSGTTGVFRMAGPGAATSSRPFNVNAGAIDIADVGGRLTLTGSLAGSGTLTKTGPGTLLLGPSTNFTGVASVTAGTLATANGANPATVNLSTLSLVGANAALAFEYDSATNPTVPLLNVTTADGLTTNSATHTLSISNPQALVPGQFTLIDYNGAPITSGFTLGALPSRGVGALVYNTANTSIDLNITGVDSTLWNGNVSANWDAGTAVNIGGTQNFKLASNSASTNFVTTDRVTFDETAAGNYLVNLTTALQPGAVTVNNETKNYTFQGPGSITGPTGLTKLGSGTLTITTNNNYTGATTVSGGTLVVGNGGTTGSLGTGALINNAAVVINRSDDITYGGSISGTGGVLTKAGNNNLTLTGAYGLDGELNVAGGLVTVTAPMAAGAYTVTKTGPGQLTLTANNNPFTGTVNVNQGTVLLDDLGAGGDLGATSIVINNGGTFIFGENGNTDFPASTVVTVNTGGVFDLKQGEDFGGVILKGGTFQMTGGTRTAVNANAAPAIGFVFESGTVTTNFTGAANGGQLGAAAFVDKTTAGTVNISGTVTFAPGMSINVREGVLEMGTANFPVAGTTSVTIGDPGTSGTLRVRDAGAASSVRPFAIGDGGGTLDIANAGGTVTLTAPVTGATGTLTKTGAGTLALTAANLYNGPTVVSGGTLRVSGSIATSSGVTVNNAAGTFEAAAAQTVRSLSVTAGQARVATGATKIALTVGDGTQTSSQLSLTGGRLDLTTNGLAIDYASSDAAGEAAVMTSVRNLIIAGFGANKDWQGNGITSANAIADKSGKAIGYALASEVLPFSSGGSPTTTDTFLGSTVDKSTAVARYTLAGDATLDGVVDFNDLVKLAQNYNTTVSAITASWWNKGDFTYDGVTDFNDLVKLAQNYNTSLPTEPIPGASIGFDADLARAFASVPEPSCLGIAGIVLAGLMGRRRDRRRAA
jgi:autotransporter-associated beta strand protein